MKEQPRMWLQFVYDGWSTTDLEVSKFTSVKAGVSSKVRLHVDFLPDSKHLIIADESLLRVDGKRQITSKLKRIEILRSSEGQSPAGTIPTPEE